MQRIEDGNGNTTTTYTDKNGVLRSVVSDGADGSKDVKQYDENGKLDREYHSDKNSSTERTYHENGQLKSERTNDVNGNGHYHAYKKDGSEDFKNEWKNDASMAAEFNNK